MYAGTVFLGGEHGELGADAVVEDVTPPIASSSARRSSAGRSPRPPAGFRKLVAGKRLWNFQQSDRDLWKSAL